MRDNESTLKVSTIAVLIAAPLFAQPKDQTQRQLDLMTSRQSATQALLDQERLHSRDLVGTIGSQKEQIRDLMQQLAGATEQLRSASAASAATANSAARTADHAMELQVQSARSSPPTPGRAVNNQPSAAFTASVAKLAAQGKNQSDKAEASRLKLSEDESARMRNQSDYNARQKIYVDAFREEIQSSFRRQNWTLVVALCCLMTLLGMGTAIVWLVVRWVGKHPAKVDG